MNNSCLTKKIFLHEMTTKKMMSPTYRILHNTGIDTNVIVDDKVLDEVLKREMQHFQESIKKDVDTMSKLSLHRSLKDTMCFEKYITTLNNRKQRALIAKARMGTLPLHIELGRFRNIPPLDRKCKHCNKVENEIHFFIHCSLYEEKRNTISSLLDKCNGSDMDKIKTLLNSHDKTDLINISNFIYNALKIRASAS